MTPCYHCEARATTERAYMPLCDDCAAEWDRENREHRETAADRCPPRE